MHDGLSGFLTTLRVVERAVGVHPFRAVFENGVPEKILSALSQMLVHQGNGDPIVVFERVRQNRATIRAQQVCLGRPTTKVVLHFDVLL